MGWLIGRNPRDDEGGMTGRGAIKVRLEDEETMGWSIRGNDWRDQGKLWATSTRGWLAAG